MDREQAKETVKGYMEDYLRSRGINTRKPFRCWNPEHTDSTPSMSYDRKRNKCHCFGCGADYDIIEMIRIEYGISDYAEAFEKAYALYGIAIDREGYKQEKTVKKTESKHDHEPDQEQVKTMKEDFTQYYMTAKANFPDSDAQKYLEKRGIGKEVADKFYLGYDANYKTFNKDEEGNDTSATWRVLLIPTGPGSYAARNIDPPKEPVKKNRYRKKGGSELFNIKALYESDSPVYIVEGEIDTLSIIEAGGQAVGLGSTSNVNKLLTLLKKKKPVQPLILALDHDDAGKKATEDLEKGLKELKIPSYRYDLCGGVNDANEALVLDRESFIITVADGQRRAAEAAEKSQEEEVDISHIQPVGGYAGIFKLHRDEDKQNLRTGYTKLDIALGGGFGNELYVMAAETGTGKSAIASVFAQNIAAAGVDVLYYALEMSTDEFIARGASAISQEKSLKDSDKYKAIKYGEILNDTYDYKMELFFRRPYSEYQEYVEEYFRRYGNHLHFIEGGIGGATNAKIISEQARAFKKKKGVKKLAVFVDYLQLLSPDPDDRSQRDMQTTISAAVKTLKALASQVGASVFLISSMANDRNGKDINSASFKYSGDIGYTGGVLLGWNWEGVTNASNSETRKTKIQTAKNTGYREMSLEVLKQRSGERDNKVKLLYKPAYNYIVEDTELDYE